MTYGPPSSGGLRLNLRWIIAAVIAIIAIISYVTKTSVNPVTGEKQHVNLSADQEIALGLQSAPQMEQQMGGVIGLSDPRAAMVEQVGQHVVDKSDAGGPNSPYRGHFQYHLLNDEQTINAFALPGGQVFITSGLYDKLENEAQLAAVLGHETGHVIGRHASEHMAQSQLGGMLATAVGVGASGNRHGMTEAMAAQFANQMIQLKFSRHDESEADSFGLKFMTQAGYDPRAMLGVMEILKRVSAGGHTPEMLQTHPLPQTRLDAIGAKIKEMFPNGVPSNLIKGQALPH